ncbi:MAG: Fe-S biogenesis protein NfuA [Pseudomonadota bacterium]
MSDALVDIKPPAQEYLRGLLARQEQPGIAVRIFVERPGTPHAECCMAYCLPGEEVPGDKPYEYEGFTAWIEGKSEPYLIDAVIDYKKDALGGQLTFRAPRSKVPDLRADASLEEKINYFLYSEINPQLASHNGNVSLVELSEDGIATLEFGGGCQGCSAVDLTLREGVEKTLMERIPELRGVRDKTDHTVRENAYYK